MKNLSKLGTTLCGFALVWTLVLSQVNIAYAEGESPESTPPDPQITQETTTGEIVENEPDEGVNNLHFEPEITALASQQMVTILALGDVYYSCLSDSIDGHADGICHYATIQNAVNSFDSRLGYGNIYAGSGSSSESVTIAAINLGVPVLSKLTGLIGIVEQGEPQTIINGTGKIQINDLHQNFTIAGFSLEGSNTDYLLNILEGKGTLRLVDLYVENLSTGGGIQINGHTGSVELLRVDATRNGTGGAGTNIASTGKVLITSSSFDNNANTGLKVSVVGSALLNGVSASNNSQGGAFFKTTQGFTIRNSVFNGNTEYGLFTDSLDNRGNILLEYVGARDNWNGSGLNLRTNGNVTLNWVIANVNTLNDPDTNAAGVMIDTCWEVAGFCTNTGTGNVIVTNSTFNSNSNNIGVAHGLYVDARGSITLKEIISTNNEHYGALLQNNKLLSGANPVTVTNGDFDYNKDYGLKVLSRGAVTLKGIDAYNVTSGTDSIGVGLYIDNSTGNAPVTLTNSLLVNEISYNAKTGVHILSKGTVTIRGLLSNTNGGLGSVGYGLYIDNTAGLGNVLVYTSNFENNRQDGIKILSHGNILLDGVRSYSSGAPYSGGLGVQGYGAYLDNKTTPAGLRTVSVYRSIFEYNSDDGLWIESDGNITLNNVYEAGGATWDDGPSYGIYLNNMSGTGSILFLDTYGHNDIASNTDSGLFLRSNKSITLNGVEVDNSGSMGADIDNSSGSGGIIINRSFFSYNETYGLKVKTNGGITLKDVAANGNTNNDGAYLEVMGMVARTVSITKGIFNNNYKGHGLFVETPGLIILNKTDVSGNGTSIISSGAYLHTTGLAGVSILGTLGENFFTYNGGRGLEIVSNGAISINKFYASWNDQAGIVLNDDLAPGNGNVNISNGYFQYNKSTGLEIYTKGSITLNSLVLENNGYTTSGGGAILDASTALPGIKAIMITRSTFSSNNGDGLIINAKSAITLNSVQINENKVGAGFFGAFIDNCQNSGLGCTGTGNVTVLGSYSQNSFNDNSGSGLEIISKGAISLYRVQSKLNDQHGVLLDNHLGTGNIIINGLELEYNLIKGLEILSAGSVTLNAVDAHYNNNSYTAGTWAVNINNTYAAISGAKPISITRTNLYQNYAFGLHVESKAVITLNKVTSTLNSFSTYKCNGIQLDNTAGIGGVNILNTLGSNEISHNSGLGLEIDTHGAVVLKGIDFHYNNQGGADINVDIDGVPITLTGLVFESNYNADAGLIITSKGYVSLTGVNTNNNGSSGVKIDNSGATSPQNVLVVKSSFNSSSDSGLWVVSKGNIILNAITANLNSGKGVLLDNCIESVGSCTGSGSVSILSTLAVNTFSNNTNDGLHIDTGKSVSISNVAALYNSVYGIWVDNSKGSGGTVILSKIFALRNANNGLKLNANGAVTLTSVQSLMNGFSGPSDGASITTNGQTITISNSVFTGNYRYGLYLDTENPASLIKLTNTSYFGNDNWGSGYDDISIVNGTLVIY